MFFVYTVIDVYDGGGDGDGAACVSIWQERKRKKQNRSSDWPRIAYTYYKSMTQRLTSSEIFFSFSLSFFQNYTKHHTPLEPNSNSFSTRNEIRFSSFFCFSRCTIQLIRTLEPVQPVIDTSRNWWIKILLRKYRRFVVSTSQLTDNY